MFVERPLTIMPSRAMALTIDPTYSASGRPTRFLQYDLRQTLSNLSKPNVLHHRMLTLRLAPDDKENVDPVEPGRHQDALLLRPAEGMASSQSKSLLQMCEAHYHLGMQLYSRLNGKANSPKDGKPNPNPKPIPAKPRRRRYPLQDITAIVYPGQVNIRTSTSYGNNSTTHLPFPGRPPYQHASSRHNVAKREALVLSLKKQATINSKAKKHFGNSCLESGERAEQAVQDSISLSTDFEKKDTIKKALQKNALIIRRRQLRRATNCIEIRKAK